jgi:UDP-glucose:(heptosyl)LPS alpha-1,3-glucosyltransferase
MHLALNFQRVDPNRGGAETYVVDLCHRLVRAGHRVDLYAETWREGVLPREVRCIAVAAPGRTKLARIMSFARNSEAALSQATFDCSVGFINTWHHDVIIPQGGVQSGSLEANAKRFPEGWRRSLYLAGKVANPKYWAYRAIERKQYDPAREARVIAVSNMVKEHLQRFHHVPRTRVHVVPNAIDANRLTVGHAGAVRCAFRNKVGLEPNDLTALFVGHNPRLKGLEPLVLALAMRKRRYPHARPIHVLVVGCSEAATAPFRRLANQLGVADAVHFAGFVPDIRACYWSSDFFALPTYYDPCSLVVFEALACGLPVITTLCNGASELMTDGREGYLLTAPDALCELAGALDRMADDMVRVPMSAQARQLGNDQSLDTHVDRLLRVFEDVASSRARRGPHLIRKATGRSVLK